MKCERCGNEFEPHPYGNIKKYCSEYCRKKEEQKRYRQNHKKKPEIRWDLPPIKKGKDKEKKTREKSALTKKEVHRLSMEEIRAHAAEHARKMREGKSYVGIRAHREKMDPYYKIKESARAKLRNAVKTGKITKSKNCQRCGSGKQIESHHFRGYDHPFDVIWLCHLCHSLCHALNNPPALSSDTPEGANLLRTDARKT